MSADPLPEVCRASQASIGRAPTSSPYSQQHSRPEWSSLTFPQMVNWAIWEVRCP